MDSSKSRLISAAPFPAFSRLNPRLSECISSDYCLPYFIQFLEYCKGLSLLHFLFACDTFREVGRTADAELHTDCGRDCGTDCNHAIGSPTQSIKSSIQRDALDIYVRYISLNAKSPAISFPENLRQRVENQISVEGGHVRYDCFDEAVEYVRQCLSSSYLPRFLDSSFCTSYRLEILQQGPVLADMLLWEPALLPLMEFLEVHGHGHHVLFWISVQAFQGHLNAVGFTSANLDDVGGDAIALYDTYLSLQARKPVHYGRIIRGIVESSISPDDGIITPDAFLIAQQYSYHYMDKMFFDLFKKSDKLQQFIREQRQELATKRKDEANLKLAAGNRTPVLQRTSSRDMPRDTPCEKRDSTAPNIVVDDKPKSRLHQVIEQDRREERAAVLPSGSKASSSKASSRSSRQSKPVTVASSDVTTNKGPSLSANDTADDILDDSRILGFHGNPDYTLGAVDEWGVYSTEDKHLLGDNTQSSDKIKKSVLKLLGKEQVSEEEAIAQAKSIVSDVMNLTSKPLNLQDLLDAE